MFLLTWIFAGPLAVVSAVLATPILNCKTSPGDPAWPSAAKWQGLNSTVQGQLIKSTPPGAVCRANSPLYSSPSCAFLQSNWQLADWHAKNPVSVDYNDDTCPVIATTSYCSDVGYPAYVVNATTSTHIQSAVNFARENNVRLVLKATGHDWPGRSSGAGSLSIWLHWLQGIELDVGNDQAVKYGAVGAMKVYAGMRWEEIYSFANDHNVTVLGGGDGRVGIGGWTLGAGHGPLTAKYGLGADQVLEMEMVTADGKLRIVNETAHPDLFWAARGGGGSTFGAVVSFTIKAYPATSITGYNYSFNTTVDSETYWSMLTWFHSKIPDMMDAGIMGYYYPEATRLLNPNLEIPNYSTIWGSFLAPDMSQAEVQAIMDPIEAYLNSSALPDKITVTREYLHFDAFFDWTKTTGFGTVGSSGRIASRLLDREALQGDPEQAQKLLRTALPPNNAVTGQMTAPRRMKPIPGGDNAVLSAWRESYVHLDIVIGWAGVGEAVDPALKATVASNLTNIVEPAFVQLAPNTGAYVSEADPTTANWQQTFWGDKYPRLLSIKNTYDPQSVFWCVPCVGHELFTISGGDGIGQSAVQICRT